MRYTRIYAAAGESQFEEVAIALRQGDFAPPAPPMHLYVLGPSGRTDDVKVENVKAMIDFTKEYGGS